MNVFFYGLFMDESVLAGKGIVVRRATVGCVDGFRLRIGERATLQRHAGARAYGVLMDLDTEELRALYSESSVSDYVPERVIVELMDGTRVEASCYNLPSDKVAGTNDDYAAALHALATRLGFPESYRDEIRQAGR